MIRCEGRNGLFSRCRLEELHPGDHDNGRRTWARAASELHIYRLTVASRARRSSASVSAPVPGAAR